MDEFVSLYEYRAHIKRVIDGDTLELIIDLGFEVTKTHVFRMVGIDAPERYSEEGIKATQYLKDLEARLQLGGGSSMFIRTYKNFRETDSSDVYGRYLAEIFEVTENTIFNINDEMLKKGLAKPYDPKA